jgi:hypothetical protein
MESEKVAQFEWFEIKVDDSVKFVSARAVSHAMKRDEEQANLLASHVASFGGFTEGGAHFLPGDCYSEENLQRIYPPDKFSIRLVLKRRPYPSGMLYKLGLLPVD